MDNAQSAAMLYRIPLDGGAIGAVAANGVPADQFAFDSRDGHFRALLARSPSGCTKPEQTGALALLDHSAVGLRHDDPPRRGQRLCRPAADRRRTAREPLRRRLAGLWRPRGLVEHGARHNRQGRSNPPW
jgi:hypothetical protein